MKNLLRFVAFALFFHSTSTQAVEGWLNLYDCQKNQERQCSSGCAPTGNHKRFTVNQRDQTVIEQRKIQGSPWAPTQYKNCTVFNERNWECDMSEKLIQGSVYRLYAMVEGKYSSRWAWLNEDGSLVTEPSYLCAK